MKIETLYDQGTVKIPEDGSFARLPHFVGVADGVSGLYHPDEKPADYFGRSGGQMAVDCLAFTFVNAKDPQERELEDLVCEANREIQTYNEWRGIPIDASDLLAGATFAVAKITEQGKQVEVIQTGDCFALWVDSDGIRITSNECFPYDKERLEKIAELMGKHQGDQGEMWKEFMPFLAQTRRDHVNIHYGIMNGQAKLVEHLRHHILFEPSLLLLFTDGLIYYPDSNDGEALARGTLELYRKGSLEAVLEATRKKEEKEKGKSHIPGGHAEATAIAIEF